jgi:uncharacterized protein with PIN domain
MMLKTNCVDCNKEIGAFAKNEEGSYGEPILMVPDEFGAVYCTKCGTPKQEAYFVRMAAGAEHKSEVAAKRLEALDKARAVRKAKIGERVRRQTVRCANCGHTLAICVCPPVEPKVAYEATNASDQSKVVGMGMALVGTLGGEVL